MIANESGATTASPTNGGRLLATRRGKLILGLLCGIAFLDFVDAPIVNVALPMIQHDLHFSVSALIWVPSGYLLTYGGFMLLGGRAADLLGRRRVLIAGVLVIGVSCLIGGLAQSEAMLISARLAQGFGAALTLPAALSILTTTYREGPDRHAALGVWGTVGGMASAIGVLIGGLLTEGPGWRWVMFVNPLACIVVLAGIFSLLTDDRPARARERVDVLGALLVTCGMLLLVYASVKAPTVGWGDARTLGELGGALALLALFVVTELRVRNPLAPLWIFRINGLGFSNATQLIAFAGFLAIFFFLTLYMQDVLGYSPIQTGAAYLPLTVAAMIGAGVSVQLLARVGTRPVIVVGALVTGAGIFWVSHIPVHGSYVNDLLPALVVIGLGVTPVFVGVTTAGNAGVPPAKAGLAASLLNASQQLGGALGLAIFEAVATSRTNHLIAAGAAHTDALTAGFQRALLIGSIFLLAAAVIALRATNTRGETEHSESRRDVGFHKPLSAAAATSPTDRSV
jgi:EmrB/QacA subfamily drug resistance transporter